MREAKTSASYISLKKSHDFSIRHSLGIKRQDLIIHTGDKCLMFFLSAAARMNRLDPGGFLGLIDHQGKILFSAKTITDIGRFSRCVFFITKMLGKLCVES